MREIAIEHVERSFYTYTLFNAYTVHTSLQLTYKRLIEKSYGTSGLSEILNQNREISIIIPPAWGEGKETTNK